jgi:hypothetical protein
MLPLLLLLLMHCLQVLSLRYSDWCRLNTPEDQARYMWHIKEASFMLFLLLLLLFMHCLQVLSLRYSDWCRLKSPEDQARYMWHIKEASVMRIPLAPDVVRVGAQQQDSSSKAPKSLTHQLWRLLVDV